MSVHQLMLDQIRKLANALGDDLLPEMVFVGGCTTGLHVTDEFSKSTVRHTKDVDLIVSVQSLHDWSTLQDILTKKGFSHPPMNEEHPICRLFLGDLPVDFMPTDTDILGFSNSWYQDGMEKATERDIGDGLIVKVLTPPHFIATKFEAFNGRGGGDYLMSHDIEDILTVVGGREELVSEIQGCDAALKSYIQENFNTSMAESDFGYAVQSMPGGLEEVIFDRITQMLK